MSEFALAPFEAGHPCSRASPVLPWAGRSQLLETGSGYVRSSGANAPSPAATSAHRRKVWETVPSLASQRRLACYCERFTGRDPCMAGIHIRRGDWDRQQVRGVVPSPSWPPLLVPQQYARSSLVTPQVRSTPPLIRVITRSVRSLVGVEQVGRRPITQLAKVVEAPAEAPSRESDAAGMVPARVHVAELTSARHGSRVGGRAAAVVPSPSCPRPPEPQQYARLAVVTPQVYAFPASICRKLSPPVTAVGPQARDAGAVAELPIAVVSPAVGPVGGGYAARVEVSRAQLTPP